MNIGILTFLGASNCGAVLQAYALQQVLRSLGHSSEIIQYRKQFPFHLRNYLRKSPAATLSLWKSHVLKRLYQQKNIRCLTLSCRKYHSLSELENGKLRYDLYITGSDQIWNSGITADGELDPVYFGTFAPSSSRLVSYAASMGQGIDLARHPDQLRQYLARYDAISIREVNIAEKLEEVIGRKVSVCMDPTLLLFAHDYSDLVQRETDKDTCPSPYLASYVLYPIGDSEGYMKKYAREHHLRWVNLVNSASGEHFKKALNTRVTPEKWLCYIKNSQCIICSSFHAVVFALIFHKPFVYICPENQKTGNARLLSLLGMLGLQDRYLSKLNEQALSLLSEEIDWKKVDRVIEQQRADSLAFLKNAVTNREE
ncbi:polysaccharide pyruvyl transferase family protein [Akkermansia sp. BIOML-A67]|uniref:polysaccharide pyruvyl transferase family protein n=1 Tax=Akkermansia sp. BIOML-A67 TaxID=2584623 RepID=UPI00122F2845|nr:polysaccharide pyruvyl transferase family protein [Akkermansia sp. BIOML-A67]KAA3146029.1 polysaccharide pyruvyl transferase family protein [Akkermansia sp. BIOML-A67]